MSVSWCLPAADDAADGVQVGDRGRGGRRRAGRGSAALPASTVPASFSWWRNRAGLRVAVCSTRSGLRPALASRSNSSCSDAPAITQAAPTASVPASSGAPLLVEDLHHAQLEARTGSAKMVRWVSLNF